MSGLESKEVEEEWDDNYCKICFYPISESPFNCGHLIHLECQIKSGDDKCTECRRQFRLTRAMWKKLWCWRKHHQLREHYPHSSDDE